MTDEAFLAAIARTPKDDTVRLIYADWLEENGNPRGDFLRLVVAVETTERAFPPTVEEINRLEAMARGMDPSWIERALAGRVWLRYHRLTFALLGEKPVMCKANVRKMERWEQRQGRRLPASLREWYSLEGAEERLQSEAEGFRSFPLSRALRGAATGDSPGFPVGDWEWGVVNAALNESEDPVITRSYDEAEGEAFSCFAFQRAWGRLTQGQEGGPGEQWGTWQLNGRARDFPLLHAEDKFGPRDRSYLAARFIEGHYRLVRGRWTQELHPITREALHFFSPTSVLRFFRPGVRLEVICQGNPEKRAVKAYWEISGDSHGGLVEAVRQDLWS